MRGFTDAAAELPLLFQPGTCWHYGINTDICGALVEAISGMPFADFVRQRIFEPLGMPDTAFWVPPPPSRVKCVTNIVPGYAGCG